MTTDNRPLAYSYLRVSSERQLKGDGINRQVAEAKAWCEEHDLNLSTATFKDLGVSAFKGDNAKIGALSVFLEAVQLGKIPEGSYLLVENLDRISRAGWEEGYLIIRKIVQNGINLATLWDGNVFKAYERIDMFAGMKMLMAYENAAEESRKKSIRLKAAWKANTKAVLEGDRIRTSQCPRWLRVEGDLKGGSYEVIEGKAEVVREVFERFANGEGPSAIARDLHKRGIPTMKDRGQWRGPTISQLLRSEAPYGHLEMGRQITEDEESGKTPLPIGAYRKGKRVMIEVVKDAMPRIIDKDIERRVRFLLEQREADVKTIKAVRNDTRITKACLTGVLKGDQGENLKRKAYTRTAAYVSPVTNQYYGAISHVDQVLVDYWPLVRKAFDTKTDTKTEELEAKLVEAKQAADVLEFASWSNPRILAAAQAEVEELELEIEERRKAGGLQIVDLPRSIEGMEPHEVNQIVRQVISRVTIRKGEKVTHEPQEVTRKDGTVYIRKMPRPMYDLDVIMRNGIEVRLGDADTGLAPEGYCDTDK